MWSIIEYFAAAGVKTLSIGAGAGAFGGGADGLTTFKRGWASGTRMTYLCGAIPDPGNYGALAAAAPRAVTNYFPAYRAEEFN